MRGWLCYRHCCRVAKVVFLQICKDQFLQVRLTRLFATGFHVVCACVRVQVGAHADANGTHFSVCKNHACVSWSVCMCVSVCQCARGTDKFYDGCVPNEALGRCLYVQILQFAELTQP